MWRSQANFNHMLRNLSQKTVENQNRFRAIQNTHYTERYINNQKDTTSEIKLSKCDDAIDKNKPRSIFYCEVSPESMQQEMEKSISEYILSESKRLSLSEGDIQIMVGISINGLSFRVLEKYNHSGSIKYADLLSSGFFYEHRQKVVSKTKAAIKKLCDNHSILIGNFSLMIILHKGNIRAFIYNGYDYVTEMLLQDFY